MTVAELMVTLARQPQDAVVLIDSDGGLSLVATVEFAEPDGPDLPPQILLLPSFEE